MYGKFTSKAIGSRIFLCWLLTQSVFEEPPFAFIDLLYCFPILYFVYFCSNLYYFLSSANFGLSSFSSSLRYRFRLFIWDPSLLLVFIAIHFPLRTTFAASDRFWYIVFSFLFISRNFNFFFDPLVIQFRCCLISMCS